MIGGGERVFCNPPYGDKGHRRVDSKMLGRSSEPNTSSFFLFRRGQTANLHDFIYEKPGVEIRF